MNGTQITGFDRLVAALRKVPPELMRQVDERAAIFVSGMEAMARVSPASAAPDPRARIGA